MFTVKKNKGIHYSEYLEFKNISCLRLSGGVDYEKIH